MKSPVSLLPRPVRPSDEQMLLLQACLATAPATLEAAYHLWIGKTDYDRLDWHSFHLIPFLHRHLKNHGIPSKFAGSFAAIYRQSWIKREIARRGMEPVLREMHAAQVPVILFKGAALAEIIYPDPLTRTMFDTDVLVPMERVDTAAAVLQKLGWQAHQLDWEKTVRWLHALGYARSKKEPGIDLHWHALRTNQHPAVTDQMWSHAVPLQWMDLPLQTLRMEHHFLHTCDHGARANNGQPLRWLLDATLLLRKNPAQFDWDFLIAETERARCTLAVRTVLHFLQQTFEPAIPDRAIRALAAQPVRWMDRCSFQADQSPALLSPKVRSLIFPELIRFVRVHGWPLHRKGLRACHEFLQTVCITQHPFADAVVVPVRRLRSGWESMRERLRVWWRGGKGASNWRKESISKWPKRRLRGFYALEYSKEHAGSLLRWSGPCAAVYLPDASADLEVAIKLLPFRTPEDAQPQFFLNDHALPAHLCKAALEGFTIQLKRPWRPERGGCWLEWKVRPWTLAIHDGRDLGVPVLAISIRPVTREEIGSGELPGGCDRSCDA